MVRYFTLVDKTNFTWTLLYIQSFVNGLKKCLLLYGILIFCFRLEISRPTFHGLSLDSDILPVK